MSASASASAFTSVPREEREEREERVGWMRPGLTFAMPIGEADSTVAGAMVEAVEAAEKRY